MDRELCHARRPQHGLVQVERSGRGAQRLAVELTGLRRDAYKGKRGLRVHAQALHPVGAVTLAKREEVPGLGFPGGGGGGTR